MNFSILQAQEHEKTCMDVQRGVQIPDTKLFPNLSHIVRNISMSSTWRAVFQVSACCAVLVLLMPNVPWCTLQGKVDLMKALKAGKPPMSFLLLVWSCFDD